VERRTQVILGSHQFWQKAVKWYIVYRVIAIVTPIVVIPVFFFTPWPYNMWELVGFMALVPLGLLVALGGLIYNFFRYGW
jgi:hypothetical protein